MKRLIAAIFSLCLMTSAFAELTEKQRVSLSMLNYIMYLTEDITTHSDNRLYLEEIDKQIRNNTFPNSIDQKYTLPLLDNYLERILDYQKIIIQRDRLRILFENQKAQAVKKSMPNPLYILNLKSGNSSSDHRRTLMNYGKDAKESFRNLAKIGLVVLDSGMKYSLAKNEAQIEYIKQNWELDDKELETLKSLSRDSFSYMTNMTIENKIDEGEKKSNTLSPQMITDFIAYQNNPNLEKKIALLEGKAEEYKNFGPYFLLLAKCYYEKAIEKEDTVYFEKVLSSISKYEKIYGHIFRKDYEFGKVLPLAVVAAREVYGADSQRYKNYVIDKVKLINDFSDDDNWTLKYFAATLYIDLARLTGNKDYYLREAYKIIINEVTHFSDDSDNLISSYIEPVSQEKLETYKNRLNVTKAKYEESKITKSKELELQYKKEIKNLEKSIKLEKEMIEQREKEKETELFPISEPLLVNCELLFNLLDEISFTAKEREIEKDKIYGILANSFVFPQLQEAYAGINPKISRSIDDLLYDLVSETNPELNKHSKNFQDKFLSEYKSVYKEVLSNKMAASGESFISDTADKIRFTNEYDAKWESSVLTIPAVFLCKESSFRVSVYSNNDSVKVYNFTLDENPGKEKKENTFYVKKILKPKILKKDKTLKDWNCNIVFVNKELNERKFSQGENCLIIVDSLIGGTEASFIFSNASSKKSHIFDQVHLSTFTDNVKEASFNFPKTSVDYNKSVKLSDLVLQVLSDYIISDNPGVKNLSPEFQKAFLEEYKYIYFEKINYITGSTTDDELVDILRNAEISKKVKASLDDTKLALHSGIVHDINEECIIDIEIFEDNQLIFSEKNTPYEIKKTNDKESVSTLDLISKDFRKIKYDSKKKYRILVTVHSGENSYPVLFNSVVDNFLFLKGQKFITFSDYLSLLLENDSKAKK